MQFTHPNYLYLLILIPFLYLIYRRAIEKKRRDIKKFYSLPFLKRHPLVLKARGEGIRFILFLTSIFLLILALTEPRFGSSREPILTREGEVIFAIDASLSMMAQDIKPDRFRRAINEMVKTLDGLGGEKAGLVIFAGSAAIVSPPTTDYGALKALLSTLDVSTFLDTGTSFERAIEASLSLFKEDVRGKFIVLLSDGESEPIPPHLLKRLVQKGIKVYTIGIGTQTGSPIPIALEEGVLSYKRDYQGRAVITRLEESTLKSLSSTTQGRYFRASEDKEAAGFLLSYLKKEGKPVLGEELIIVYTDKSWYFIFAALVFLLLSVFLSEGRRAAMC